ncbi:histone-lysine N-methyltransferase SETMAR [Plakobranchus ocellatus]|uniref:Histone-lysine N-methyltransferase SETMAR n=1 Tax=Plakobranchus ocellatus TaxID=259542 RepID=A0AAV3YEQ1_9GAST|nr:histone-lysine N-methyltransferase SETMAR [Plakobranchus ocellatus]
MKPLGIQGRSKNTWRCKTGALMKRLARPGKRGWNRIGSVVKAGNKRCCPFSVRKGNKKSVIYREIVENYREHAMSMTQVYQWCSCSKDSRTSLQDEPRSGRPNTANNDWYTAPVDELIKVDGRVTLKEISLKLDIPKTNVYEIVHHKLGYCKVSAR